MSIICPAEFDWHFVRNCEIIHITPSPPRNHELLGGELNQPMWVGPAHGGWENKSSSVSGSRQLGKGAICRQFW